ncbi:protein tyrosine kinase [Fragilaria crotonensis]|nr:protein tyrosine kinase [Fragilaria crotonensis]
MNQERFAPVILSPQMKPNANAFETFVGEAVKKRVALFDKCTVLPKPRRRILELEWDGIDTSETRVLGRGSFSCVHLVGLYDSPRESFALKQLNLCSTTASAKQYKRGAIDIALEARLISCLDHENIIKLHAIKKGCVGTSISDKDEPFFLVLDYLPETLENRLESWRNEENAISRLKAKVSGHDENLMYRLESAAIGIAKGMEYLHSLGVLFRDLKPENLGFDSSGVIKIFDFGVARDLVYVKEVKDRLGFTGTPRYMANEVGAGKEYGLPADVYSFGIVLHEICTLKTPFSHLRSVDAFRQKVALGGERPKLSSVKHAGLRSLMQRCWDPIPDNRPSFTDIRIQLETIISKSRTEQKQALRRLPSKKSEPRSRRSTLKSSSENLTNISSSSLFTSRGMPENRQTFLRVSKVN